MASIRDFAMNCQEPPGGSSGTLLPHQPT
jgi:hypothetical protein